MHKIKNQTILSQSLSYHLSDEEDDDDGSMNHCSFLSILHKFWISFFPGTFPFYVTAIICSVTIFIILNDVAIGATLNVKACGSYLAFTFGSLLICLVFRFLWVHMIVSYFCSEGRIVASLLSVLDPHLCYLLWSLCVLCFSPLLYNTQSLPNSYRPFLLAKTFQFNASDRLLLRNTEVFITLWAVRNVMIQGAVFYFLMGFSMTFNHQLVTYLHLYSLLRRLQANWVRLVPQKEESFGSTMEDFTKATDEELDVFTPTDKSLTKGKMKQDTQSSNCYHIEYTSHDLPSALLDKAIDSTKKSRIANLSAIQFCKTYPPVFVVRENRMEIRSKKQACFVGMCLFDELVAFRDKMVSTSCGMTPKAVSTAEEKDALARQTFLGYQIMNEEDPLFNNNHQSIIFRPSDALLLTPRKEEEDQQQQQSSHPKNERSPEASKIILRGRQMSSAAATAAAADTPSLILPKKKKNFHGRRHSVLATLQLEGLKETYSDIESYTSDEPQSPTHHQSSSLKNQQPPCEEPESTSSSSMHPDILNFWDTFGMLPTTDISSASCPKKEEHNGKHRIHDVNAATASHKSSLFNSKWPEGIEKLKDRHGEDIIDVLTYDLFVLFLGDRTDTFLKEADKGGRGRVDRKQFSRLFISIYKQRKQLLSILSSQANIPNLFQILIGIIVTVLLMCVYLLTVGVPANTIIVSGAAGMSGIMVACSFLYSNFIQSVTFVCFMNPYNVGDRVRIHGDLMTVKKITTFFTEFNDVNGKPTTFNHSYLYGTKIVNESRSQSATLDLTVMIADSTPPDKYQHLKKSIEHFTQTRQEFVKNSFHCILNEIALGQYLKFTIWVSTTDGWGHPRSVWATRGLLWQYILHQCEVSNIEYKLPITRIEGVLKS